MEYMLELPQDIIWDGRQSPVLSPSHLSNASTEQVLIFEDNFANELIPNDDDLMKSNQEEIVFAELLQPDEFEQLLQLQQELESIDNMDEEVVSNDQWLDQPINVPVDEYVPVQDARICPVKGNTAQLLNEFNQVYDAVELTHLTPPETPPHSPPQTLQVYLDQQAKNQFYSQANLNYQQTHQQCQKPMPIAYAPTQHQQQPIPSVTAQFPSILEQAISLVQQAAPIEYADNIDDAMAEVEALVRSRAEDFAESSSIDDDSSICDSSSTCFSPRSDASSPRSNESLTDDSDWTLKSSLAIGAALKAKQAKQKRKPRKNRRSLEDRQSRKKEQNKTAANRYRLKKKAEIEILLDEERELQAQNDKLQKQYDEVSREASYIKRLLRAAFEAKGIL